MQQQPMIREMVLMGATLAAARRLRVIAFAGIHLVLAGAGFADDQRTLCDHVRDAHQASRESIRTLSCKVATKYSPALRSGPKPADQESSGQFWYGHNALRAKVIEVNGEAGDYLWKDSVRKAVSRRATDGQKSLAGHRQQYTSPHQLVCDPFRRGLLALDLLGGVESVPFEKMLEKATRLVKAERITIGGKQQVLVELFFERATDKDYPWNVQLYFEPRANYLVRKIVYSMIGWDFSRGDEVVSFKEVAKGVFFPERVTGWTNNQGKPWGTSIAEITDIRVNQPLPPGIFEFRYPEGVAVADAIKGSVYPVNPEGNAISKPKPIAKGAGQQLSPLSQGTESNSEAVSLTTYILPLLLGLLGIVALGFMVRKWRSEQE